MVAETEIGTVDANPMFDHSGNRKWWYVEKYVMSYAMGNPKIWETAVYGKFRFRWLARRAAKRFVAENPGFLLAPRRIK